MTEESRMMASDCRWEMGGGYWSVLLNSSGVEGKKEKKSLGSAASERRMTDRVGGIIWMVWIRSRSASEGSASSRLHSGRY